MFINKLLITYSSEKDTGEWSCGYSMFSYITLISQVSLLKLKLVCYEGNDLYCPATTKTKYETNEL
jgi:hypothetical protein